ncbi:MAG: tetratricopeptide repeat protein [Okeania sp. SIO2F4]|uniref:tetratricopeptide repeat-containing sulfotransferase family protein n=1 Tax=Okeania sp. SIO2F4 TaxID=2607790 RepID=UPI00142B22D4|nr:tetratricopeptide repeat-containing sulfotransferase family protein [Okeania sp. SIO2F4]NES04497.1 tetratricopeptide repeat protein [Okeania sp. SIO2F4]
MNYYELAEKFLEQQKWEEAVTNYRQAVKLNPNFSWSYYKLGQALTKLQKWEEAITTYQKAIELNSDFPWSYHHLGNALLQLEKWEEAVNAYQNFLQINSDNYWTYHKLGEALFKLGEFDQAILYYQKAIQLNPEIKGTHQKLADILFKIGKLEAAETAYRQAIKLNPEVVWYRQCLGDILLRQKRLDEAIATYLEVAQITPNLTWMHLQLGDAFAQLGESNLDETINYYCQIIKNPDRYPIYQKLLYLIKANPEIYLELGNYLAQENQISGAIIIYYLLLEILPNQIEIYQQLGKIFRQKIQLEQQLNSFYSVVEANPDSQSYYHLGLALTKQQKWLEATIAYHRAIELNPDFAWWSDIRLWETFQKQDKLQKIVNLFQKFIDSPNNSICRYLNLAEALTQVNRKTEAIKIYQTASQQQIQQNYPNFFLKSQNLAKISAPNFLIIGVKKGGTTSIYHYLIQHPQILPAIKKEIDFWSFYFHRGLDWYRAHFPAIPESEKFLTGEASPSYFDAPDIPARLFHFFPKIKLIVLLRNPVDRTISNYYHEVRSNAENMSVEEVINSRLEKLIKISSSLVKEKDYWNYQGDYIASSVYLDWLKKWLNIFPREQLLILPSEEFYSDPKTTMKQVFNFLGLQDYQIQNYPKLNSGSYSSISESLRQKLNDYFQPHNQRLEEYLGMKFNW